MATRFWRCIEGGMYRLDETACRMRCVFCPTSVKPTEGLERAVAALDTDAVLAELEQILDSAPAELNVRLTADDLMTFPGFLGILDAFKRHGRRFELDTPGLRLADAAFAQQVAGYDVYLNVSCQAATPEVYTDMTGNPRAFELVRAAIGNLQRFRIPFGVNCVITAMNCGSLFDIARFLLLEMGLPTFSLAHFYPEQVLLDDKPDAWNLLPSYAEVDKQLARIGALCTATDKRVQVFDVAPCQLRSRVVRDPRLSLEFIHGPRFVADSPTARYKSPHCDRCVVNARCAYVSQRDFERNPGMQFDPERVRRDLAIRQRLLPPLP